MAVNPPSTPDLDDTAIWKAAIFAQIASYKSGVDKLTFKGKRPEQIDSLTGDVIKVIDPEDEFTLLDFLVTIYKHKQRTSGRKSDSFKALLADLLDISQTEIINVYSLPDLLAFLPVYLAEAQEIEEGGLRAKACRDIRGIFDIVIAAQLESTSDLSVLYGWFISLVQQDNHEEYAISVFSKIQENVALLVTAAKDIADPKQFWTDVLTAFMFSFDKSDQAGKIIFSGTKKILKQFINTFDGEKIVRLVRHLSNSRNHAPEVLDALNSLIALLKDKLFEKAMTTLTHLTGNYTDDLAFLKKRLAYFNRYGELFSGDDSPEYGNYQVVVRYVRQTADVLENTKEQIARITMEYHHALTTPSDTAPVEEESSYDSLDRELFGPVQTTS